MKKKIEKTEESAYSKDMQRRLITFDWAIKNILRDKENFDILEGFLSELLGYDITIVDLLESESNRETEAQKSNRVDLLAKDSTGILILIEVQYEFEYDYYQRMLFGASKLVTEYMNKGKTYGEVRRVVAVHIVHFDLGSGEDYLYKGSTVFKGLHYGDDLGLSERQKELFSVETTPEIFPQYYIIRIKKYADELKNPFDEWVYFLKTGEIKDDFKAKNILNAKKKLDILCLNETDRFRYERYAEDLMYEKSMVISAKIEGFDEGVEEGFKEGAKQAKCAVASSLKKNGIPMDIILKATGLSAEEIEKS